MNIRSLRNGAIVAATLGALTGLGTMVASASTGPGAAAGGNAAQQRDNGADQRGNGADQRGNETDRPVDPNQSPVPFDPSASPTAPAAQDAGATNACVAVRAIDPQLTGDAQLCTTVQRTGLRIDQVRVSLAAPAGDCVGTVTLRLNTGQNGGGLTDTASCTGNAPATAVFTPSQQVTNGSRVCGELVADNRFEAAQACVTIAA